MDGSREVRAAEAVQGQKPSPGVLGRAATATPVGLTVLATLLAGLSSGEMTQAQYHRALAAQQQSRVADQWNFFQAKRIRGTNLELAAEQLPPCEWSGAHALREQLELLQGQWQRLDQFPLDDPLPPPPGASTAALSTGRARLVAELRGKVVEAQLLRESLAKELQAPTAAAALSLVAVGQLPGKQGGPSWPTEVQKALTALRARAPEKELAELAAQISEAELAEATAAALARAAEFDKYSRPVTRALDDLADLAGKLAGRAATVRRLLARALYYPEDSPGPGVNLYDSGQRTAHEVARAAEVSEEIARELRSARYTLRARCYEREARDNEMVAGLYEIQVRKCDGKAERHRRRSQHFFYGMLLAQVGVTVASLSLALRNRSGLWALSGAAGAMALAFSGYVYFFL